MTTTVRGTREFIGITLLALLMTIPTVAAAADPFEIQVYDGTANAPGVPGLEFHLNHVAMGLRDAQAPALPMNRVTHMTLEPSIGLAEWWELGGYLQGALRADGEFDYAGVKLRSKFVTIPSFHEHARLGVNLELSMLPKTYEPDHWGGEIRPIAAWEDTHWLFAVNPIVGTPLAGRGFSGGPTFEPAAMALRKFGRIASAGVEYYSSLGPFAHVMPLRAQEHYLYEVVNLVSIAHLEVNVGVGEGLTAASNPFVIKMIVGWSFEREEPSSSKLSRGGGAQL